MKTRLLPISAFISVSALAPVQAAESQAYVTDSYGEIVRDNYGSCVRSTKWTADTSITSCEKSTSKANATKTTTNKAIKSESAKEILTAVKEDIKGDKSAAYVIDANGMTVRDNYCYCVRSINWTKEIAIPKCEGWAEPKPVVKAKPVIVEKPKPVVAAPVVKDDAPATFRGFFDTNKAELKEAAFAPLNNYVDYLNRNTDKQVNVVGHTDSTGSAAYNQKLSEKRAEAVKSYLTAKDIQPNRITTQGAGESQPIASNKTKEGRAQNRRVEIEILK